mgnify:CR=1 FL=1
MFFDIKSIEAAVRHAEMVAAIAITFQCVDKKDSVKKTWSIRMVKKEAARLHTRGKQGVNIWNGSLSFVCSFMKDNDFNSRKLRFRIFKLVCKPERNHTI